MERLMRRAFLQNGVVLSPPNHLKAADSKASNRQTGAKLFLSV